METPNALKLSEPRGWRDRCAVGGEGGGPEAAGVTAARVRCSAWFGVGVRNTTDPPHDALSNFSARSESPKACGAGEADDLQTFANGSSRREARARLTSFRCRQPNAFAETDREELPPKRKLPKLTNNSGNGNGE